MGGIFFPHDFDTGGFTTASLDNSLFSACSLSALIVAITNVSEPIYASTAVY